MFPTYESATMSRIPEESHIFGEDMTDVADTKDSGVCEATSRFTGDQLLFAEDGSSVGERSARRGSEVDSTSSGEECLDGISRDADLDGAVLSVPCCL